jgi:hypothetical protein
MLRFFAGDLDKDGEQGLFKDKEFKQQAIASIQYIFKSNFDLRREQAKYGIVAKDFKNSPHNPNYKAYPEDPEEEAMKWKICG